MISYQSHTSKVTDVVQGISDETWTAEEALARGALHTYASRERDNERKKGFSNFQSLFTMWFMAILTILGILPIGNALV